MEEWFAVFFDAVESNFFRNFSFAVGVFVAVFSIVSVRITARRKQTADMLFGSRADDELIAGLRCVAKLHEATDANMRAFAKSRKTNTRENKSIRYVLNHYEAISVGMQSGIYDEEMLRNTSYNTIVNLHKRAAPFIDAIREESGRVTLYQEFRWMAERWEKKPLKQKEKKS